MPPCADGVGVSSSSASSSHVCVPHTCITWKIICLGLIGDLSEYKFVFDEDMLDVDIDATQPDVREEGHTDPWTPSMLVCVYIFLLQHM